MNRFTSFAAAALAATGIAFAPAPAAAASPEDIAKILAGIAVVGIIAKTVDDRNDRKKAARTEAAEFPRWTSRDDRYHGDRRIIDGTIRPYHGFNDRWGPKPGRGYKQQALPEQCLLRVETERGTRLAYGARCLDRTYRFADKLPQSCETVVRTRRGLRTVYGARCLERDGWRVARR